MEQLTYIVQINDNNYIVKKANNQEHAIEIAMNFFRKHLEELMIAYRECADAKKDIFDLEYINQSIDFIKCSKIDDILLGNE